MKRFWQAATVDEIEGGWTVLLDGRPVRTPARHQIVLPRLSIAREIAAEWDAQEDLVAPLTMPMTRAASTCHDRVAPQLEAVQETVGAYGETDLLCYRADYPDALVDRQAFGWDPLLAWASEAFGAALLVQTGVMHLEQPAQSVAALKNAVRAESAWPLTALAEMTTISGSLVLALAVRHGHISEHEAWHLSRIDEQWNIDQWGEDHEAARQSARREADFKHAAHLLALFDSNEDAT